MQTSQAAQNHIGNPYLAYGEFEARTKPINDTQSLWRVHSDHYFACPEERFLKGNSPLIEATTSCGDGLLSNYPHLPKGMLTFAGDLAKRFGVTHSQHVSPGDIGYKLLTHLDFSEPYYVLCDSPVQLNPGAQVGNTYRTKDTKSVLVPDDIEVFQVVEGYDFPQFKAANDLMMHPATQAVLNGQYVKHAKRGDQLTKQDILAKLEAILWGAERYFESWIDDWAFDHYHELSYNPQTVDEVALETNSIRDLDKDFWHVFAVGCVMWLKSPYSLRYLTESHPVYYAVLGWNKQTNEPEIRPESGGVAVVSGMNIFTLDDLTVETGVTAGSCVICKESLHCTDLVNSWAVVDPICNCGKPIQIRVGYPEEPLHDLTHRNHECNEYKAKHPGYPRVDFICQHCLFAKVNKVPMDMPCGRVSCPNTKCLHHAGKQSYVRELTRRRTMMLTHQ